MKGIVVVYLHLNPEEAHESSATSLGGLG